MSVLAVRPNEIASVWMGETEIGNWQVVVTLKSGSKTVLRYYDDLEAAQDWDRIVAAMGDDVERAGKL